jgi:hypothetical protein
MSRASLVRDLEHWLDAYPLAVFPEPDLKKARALLEAGGMTLDSLSAWNFRHILRQVIDMVETDHDYDEIDE